MFPTKKNVKLGKMKLQTYKTILKLLIGSLCFFLKTRVVHFSLILQNIFFRFCFNTLLVNFPLFKYGNYEE